MLLLCLFLGQVQPLEANNSSATSVEENYDCGNAWGVILYNLPYLKGKHICFDKGDFYAGKDCSNYNGRMISFKVRPGYAIHFYDRYGKLIHKATKDIRRYIHGFHKFTVVKQGGGYGYGYQNHHNETPTDGAYRRDDQQEECFGDWAMRLYEGDNYHGRSECFRNGDYYAGKETPNYYGKKISFKIKPGYSVCFYDRYGKLIRKCQGDVRYYVKGYHKFCVRKETGGGHHEGGGYQQPQCEPDWGIRIYEKDRYGGLYKCFKTGEYEAGHCAKYFGQKISFKVKPGYYVCFYDRYGRLIKKCRSDVSYFPNRFHKFCLIKEGSTQHQGGGYGQPECKPDWAVQIYNDPGYRGQYKCYADGAYYAGKDCPNYTGRRISIKIRNGYYVCFYDRYGKLIKKSYNSITQYPNGFYKLCVLKKGSQESHHGGDYGQQPECGADWAIQVYERKHYQGQSKCFPLGEYEAGHCAKYYGQQISFKIKKGYNVCFYDRYGRLIKRCVNQVNYFPNRFHKFCVRKNGGGHYGN